MKTDIKDYIKVFGNEFFSKKQCQLIINSLDISKKTKHRFYAGAEIHVGEDPYIIVLKEKKIKPIGDLIKSQWYKILTEYILNWLNKEEGMNWYKAWNGYTFPKFIEYNKGTSMKIHWDNIDGIFTNTGQAKGIPTLSIITTLNDNYSGGEIIMCDKYEYRLKTGETIIFPSNFLYPHSIKKITKGRRYSMISWVY